MKKILISILALIICVSMFAGCGNVIENLPELSENDNSEGSTNREDAQAPTIDKKAVADAFNKIDLSAFAGISFGDIDALSNIIMQANVDLTVDTDEGQEKIELGVQSKDDVYHIISKNTAEDGSIQTTEIFQVLEGSMATVYQKYTDSADADMSYDWQMAVSENAPAGSAMGMLSSVDPEAIADMIAKIQIPKLDEKHITDVDGMALISNDYIVDLIVANLDVIYGVELDANEIKNTRNEITETLTEANFALYFAVNDNGINKMAVGMEVEDTNVYAQIALSEDCKALDNLTLNIVNDFGGDGFEYAPESTLVIKPIYVTADDVSIIAGADIDLTLYAQSWSNLKRVEGSEKMEQTSAYAKYVADVTINPTNIGKVNADIITLNFAQSIDKIVDYEIEYDDDYNRTVLSAKENTTEDKSGSMSVEGVIKSVNGSQVMLDATLKTPASATMDIDAVLNYTFSGDELIFSGNLVAFGRTIQFSADVSFADFTMPELPEVSETQTPIMPKPVTPEDLGGTEIVKYHSRSNSATVFSCCSNTSCIH